MKSFQELKQEVKINDMNLLRTSAFRLSPGKSIALKRERYERISVVLRNIKQMKIIHSDVSRLNNFMIPPRCKLNLHL